MNKKDHLANRAKNGTCNYDVGVFVSCAKYIYRERENWICICFETENICKNNVLGEIILANNLLPLSTVPMHLQILC